MPTGGSRYALVGLVLAVLSLPSGPTPRSFAADLLVSHPCGPDSMTGPLRRLIPQGAFGADFRPACRAHDACYDTPGADKTVCDGNYLRAMNHACESSRHPVFCRMTARLLHRAASQHGGDAFSSAQSIAFAKVARSTSPSVP